MGPLEGVMVRHIYTVYPGQKSPHACYLTPLFVVGISVH